MKWIVVLVLAFGQPGEPPVAHLFIDVPTAFNSEQDCKDSAQVITKDFAWKTDLPVAKTGWICVEKKGA